MIMSKVRKPNRKATSLSKAVFVDDYRWEIAFEAIKELVGANKNAIRRASKVTPLPAARMMLTELMYRELQMSPTYVARQMNKNVPAIYVHLKSFGEYQKEEPYKSYYEAFKELFYKKLRDLGYCCPHCGALEPVARGDKPLKPIRK